MHRFAVGLLVGLNVLAFGDIAPARDITDMTGRTVRVPDRIERVITLGSVPVINSFIFAAGKAPLIANGLPKRFVDAGRWSYQFVFAPQIAKQPDLQDNNYVPDIEKVLQVRPDVALSFERSTADILQSNGISTVLLRLHTAEDIKNGVKLIGDLLGNVKIGAEFADDFDKTLTRVSERIKSLPPDKRPTALYINPSNMTQPHLIAEWWIRTAGGRSVTDNGRTHEVLSLTTEAVIAADPDYIIVLEPKHVRALKSHSTLAQLKAVKEGRILVTPMGAHTWGNRTVEQALTVLWAATKLHPDRFKHAELVNEVRRFYSTFFRIKLTDPQIEKILSGTI